MKNLNMKRFLSVARWDLTVNRKFYIRLVLIIACCVVVPVLFRYVTCLLGGTAHAVRSGLYPGYNIVGGLDDALLFVGSFIQFILLGYTFHNLRTRQGRISELTLPATNLERFLWHVLFVLVAPAVVFVLSLLVADGMHALLSSLLLGNAEFHSLTSAVLCNKEVEEFYIFINDGKVCDGSVLSWISIWVWLMLASYFSTFVLGNAWKYRSNIGITLGLHILLCLAVMIACGFLVSIFPSVNWANRFFSWLINAEIPKWVGIMLMETTAVALLGGIWWLSYKLYCRAQITTRRNP